MVASLEELRRQDIEDYIRFCQSPLKAWIGSKQTARFKMNKASAWSIAIGGLCRGRLLLPVAKSLQALFAVLSTYFNYLVSEDYLRVNPIALIRQK